MRKYNPRRLLCDSRVSLTLYSEFSAKITAILAALEEGAEHEGRGAGRGFQGPELYLSHLSSASVLGTAAHTIFLQAAHHTAPRIIIPISVYGRGWQMCKGPDYISGFAGYTVSVANNQLCCCSMKAATDSL